MSEAQHTGPQSRTMTLFAHLSREYLSTVGQEMGLRGEPLRYFTHFNEVSLQVRVAEDGAVEVLACQGRTLMPICIHEREDT